MIDMFWRWLIDLDIFLNDKWLGGRAETISGRCYRSECWCCKWLCKHLDLIDPDHCRKSYYGDRLRNPDLPI
jgi:hypothetical protein